MGNTIIIACRWQCPFWGVFRAFSDSRLISRCAYDLAGLQGGALATQLHGAQFLDLDIPAMVTQPAYLRNLKALSRERYNMDGSDEDFHHAAQEFVRESDRGAIILVATGIEDMLEDRILQKLPALKEDEATRKRMFERDGQLASFSKKNEMAYAMGIIDAEYRDKIDLIREIRNVCAHARKPVTMENPSLRAACEIVISDMLPDLIDRKPGTIRIAFVIKCMMVSLYIMSGKKIEGKEAQLAYREKIRREGPRNATP